MASGIKVLSDKSVLLQLELLDGTSQIVQITEEQASHLGIELENELALNPVINNAENFQNVISTEQNDLPEESTAQSEAVVNFMYKIVKPEDLNLKPSHLPRGRPRKRPSEQISQEPTKAVKETQVVIKQVRTRSGRITKPPRYIGKDFKIIDTSDGDKNETELKIAEYKRLEPDEKTAPDPPLVKLEQHSRKRKIPPHYRCPTCNKAYLGKMKMLRHFHKYPDHGPVPRFCKLKHNSTWNFLILTTQKFKDGSKGLKFCQELTVLLENVRILAKFLFKPVENGGSTYFVDDYLAHVFGIVPGDYSLNENELHKDISAYTFLEMQCLTESNNGPIAPGEKHSRQELSINETDYVNHENIGCGKKIGLTNLNVLQNEKTQENLKHTINNKQILLQSDVKTCSFTSLNECSVNLQNNSCSVNDKSQNINVSESNVNKSVVDFISTNFSSHTESVVNNFHESTLDGVPHCDQSYTQQNSHTSSGSSCLALERYDGHQKHFILNQINFENLNSHLESVLGSSNQLVDPSADYHALNIDVDRKTLYENGCTDLQKTKGNSSVVHEQGLSNCSSSEIAVCDNKCSNYNINKHRVLHTELLSQVDDLMLDSVNCTEEGKQSSTLHEQNQLVVIQDASNNRDSTAYQVCKHGLGNDLLTHVDEFMLENIDTTTEHKNNTGVDSQIEITDQRGCDGKKNSDYEIDKQLRLHNELLSHVDELMLENVDTAHVSTILDTSSNSDDIMNVDQFVNERFKKLTEPDIELQNASLNLDLPPLEMFNFHTS